MLEIVGSATDPMQIAQEFASQIQILEPPQAIAIGGLAGARALARVRGAGALSQLDATWIAYDGNMYQVSVLCSQARYAAEQSRLRAIGRSFAPLGARDHSLIEEQRLRAVRARGGESLEQLLDRTGAAWEPEEAAVANAIASGDPLRKGQLVKVARREPYRRP